MQQIGSHYSQLLLIFLSYLFLFLEMEFATLQRPSYEDLERRRRMREGSPSPVKGSSGSRGLQRKGKSLNRNKVTTIKKVENPQIKLFLVISSYNIFGKKTFFGICDYL